MVRGYAVHRLAAAMRAAAGKRFFASAPEAGAVGLQYIHVPWDMFSEYVLNSHQSHQYYFRTA